MTTVSGSLIQLPRETIRALADAVSSATGAGGGVDALRDAGHAGGSALYQAFSGWLRESGHADPAGMPLDEFSSRAATFFESAGWGTVALRSSHDALAVVDVSGCWEAEANGGRRGCHVTTGALAGFLAPLADYEVAVMEIECGGGGGGSCRFLAGNAEMLDDAYNRLVAGESWKTIGAGDL